MEDINLDLWWAAKSGSIKDVERALAKGADINWKYVESVLEYTPVQIAEKHKHFEIVKYLLGKGADSSGLLARYSVEIKKVLTTEKNQVVGENSSLINELKVKYETLIQEKKEWNQSQSEWKQKEVAWKGEIFALELQRNEAIKQRDEVIKQRDEVIKQRDEAIAASAELQAIIQKMQTNMLNETTKIERLQLQQQTKVVSSSSEEFRELLMDIALELTPEEWKNMSHRFDIPKNKLPDSAFNFFWWLMETKKISFVDLSRLEKLLNQHHRPQLVDRFITPYRLRNANK